MATPAIGIDFGTTNTVVALAGQGAARLVSFAHEDGRRWRSARRCPSTPTRSTRSERVVEAGPWAIDAYVEEPLETRFIQSFKTYAASPLFVHTNVLGRWFRFEDLLSAFLVRLRAHAGDDMAEIPKRLIVGRPVNFAGLQPDPALALPATNWPSAASASRRSATPTSRLRRRSSSLASSRATPR